jgi:hypothetical protein
MKLLRVGLPIAALLLGAGSIEASTVGVQGVPTLNVYWQNGQVPWRTHQDCRLDPARGR